MNILGVNQAGYEAANEVITDGRDLPWLQEAEGDAVWTDWGIRYRDVVIIDGENMAVSIYNLSDNDLMYPAQREELIELFREAAATLP